jgi:Spy/CpxP family protein refolding chaperone
MKTRKKKYFIISGIVLFIMILTGVGLVAAWGPGRCFDRGFHPGFHGRGFHPGFHNKDFSDFILWRLDKKMEDLNLTDVQKEKFEKIKGKIEAQLKAGIDDRKRVIEEFHTEINKENPDVKALAEKVKKKMEEISEFMDENLDLIVEFYETLDDTQKNKILDSIRERMEHHRT